MATYTDRLNLKKPSGTDPALIADINSNMDKLDQNAGTFICTSSTRPSQPFTGQQIFETDTNDSLIWSGSAWLPLFKQQEQGSVDFLHRRGTSSDNYFNSSEYSLVRFLGVGDIPPTASSITYSGASAHEFKVTKPGFYLIHVNIALNERDTAPSGGSFARLKLSVGSDDVYSSNYLSSSATTVPLIATAMKWVTPSDSITASVYANMRTQQSTGNSGALNNIYIVGLNIPRMS